jgi:hypothetical protein
LALAVLQTLAAVTRYLAPLHQMAVALAAQEVKGLQDQMVALAAGAQVTTPLQMAVLEIPPQHLQAKEIMVGRAVAGAAQELLQITVQVVEEAHLP